MAATALPAAKRKQILRVIFISLLLDLVGDPLEPTAHMLMGNPLDILHLHTTSLPEAPRILPESRSPGSILDFRPQSHPPRPQCLQTLLFSTDQRQV